MRQQTHHHHYDSPLGLRVAVHHSHHFDFQIFYTCRTISFNLISLTPRIMTDRETWNENTEAE